MRAGTTPPLVTRQIGSYGDSVTQNWALSWYHTPGAGAKTYSLRGLLTNNVSGATTTSLYINNFGWVATASYTVPTTLTIMEIRRESSVSEEAETIDAVQYDGANTAEMVVLALVFGVRDGVLC